LQYPWLFGDPLFAARQNRAGHFIIVNILAKRIGPWKNVFAIRSRKDGHADDAAKLQVRCATQLRGFWRGQTFLSKEAVRERTLPNL
jgi:hypothetical protein